MNQKKFLNRPLEDHVYAKIDELKKADIVVGIPSFNNGATIGNIISTFVEGLKKYYPSFKSVIVDADAKSKDRTAEIARKTKILPGIEKIVTNYKGPCGKGSAFRTIFEIARRLEAKVCVVSDADTKSITSQWVYALINPILCSEYGFITPYYNRDKHDATVTNALVYPMTRALYGIKIRQPIGGDFAFSNGALQVFTRKSYWESHPYITRFGVDIWMTTTAINEGFRICQTFLGNKVHDQKDPGKDLSSMFIEVVGTLFGLMPAYEFKWRNIMGAKRDCIIGDFKFTELEVIKVDHERLISNFYSGYSKYKTLWKVLFDKKTFLELEKIIKTSTQKDLVIPVDLWVKVVYEFACAYNFVLPQKKELILKSMLPLYYLRTASFMKEATLFSDEIADAVVEGDAGVFERMKSYLIDRWDSYKSKGKKISIQK